MGLEEASRLHDKLARKAPCWLIADGLAGRFPAEEVGDAEAGARP